MLYYYKGLTLQRYSYAYNFHNTDVFFLLAHPLSDIVVDRTKMVDISIARQIPITATARAAKPSTRLLNKRMSRQKRVASVIFIIVRVGRIGSILTETARIQDTSY